MSDNILSMIDRQGKVDMLIFFCLAIFTLIMIYVLMYYIKPMFTIAYWYSAATTPKI